MERTADTTGLALLVIDMINTYDHEDAELLIVLRNPTGLSAVATAVGHVVLSGQVTEQRVLYWSPPRWK
ncbi:hypothetical protein ABZ490_26610 [Streptomyces sp. NPDC005811]|uniref:hypothetical protein n=1 Tax=Streptomyces sp. NPDC005811 TaxID=3154565 RepID=UPI0033CA0215